MKLPVIRAFLLFVVQRWVLAAMVVEGHSSVDSNGDIPATVS